MPVLRVTAAPIETWTITHGIDCLNDLFNPIRPDGTRDVTQRSIAAFAILVAALVSLPPRGLCFWLARNEYMTRSYK